MAQNVLYSTIVMVYFKQKNRTRKSNPLFTVKSRIESYKWYEGLALPVYFTVNRVTNTSRCIGEGDKPISTRGLSLEIATAIAFT